MDHAAPTTTTAADWAAVHTRPDFVELRRAQRRFAFPVAGIFLAWYLLYVLLADYAHGFMAVKLVGNITTGLLLGLLQFASTFLIAALYSRYATTRLDPLAARIRAAVERGEP
ncbi:DUF485 domain-containing protein [Umezawaea tangerina]|uniref:Uncharacterized membrane protein (DUF485 family) n=1 Tax=Umezawaea tangerina TaxID=84725 RepID=A0A2T0SQC7_9PSEU|nr:DUF485 domain-containing protein [Umezawaea tangerina]PRY35615.1 uncharacterized membrane protein (DUF485 family) [Umezawaea tangerina]